MASSSVCAPGGQCSPTHAVSIFVKRRHYTPGMPGRGGWASRRHGRAVGLCTGRVCPKNRLATEYPIESMTCQGGAALAHIVFHSLCAKSVTVAWRIDRGGTNGGLPPPRPGSSGEGLWKSGLCIKNMQRKFFLINQGDRDGYVRLRTILSTKNVKKAGRACRAVVVLKPA